MLLKFLTGHKYFLINESKAWLEYDLTATFGCPIIAVVDIMFEDGDAMIMYLGIGAVFSTSYEMVSKLANQ